jgi:hypothetical protein
MGTMKTRKVRVTANQLNQLIADVRTVPAEPVGDHLSDDLFIGYATETLTMEEVQQIDQHLASCPDCTAEMEPLVAASEVWRGEPGKQRLAALRERLQEHLRPVTLPGPPLRERLADWLRPMNESLQALFERKPAKRANEELAEWPLAAATYGDREIWKWQSEDGILRGHAVLEANGDLTFRFASKDLRLEGSRFYLRLGSLRREVVLQRVSETEVGDEVDVPRHERPSEAADILFAIEVMVGESQNA